MEQLQALDFSFTFHFIRFALTLRRHARLSNNTELFFCWVFKIFQVTMIFLFAIKKVIKTKGKVTRKFFQLVYKIVKQINNLTEQSNSTLNG